MTALWGSETCLAGQKRWRATAVHDAKCVSVWRLRHPSVCWSYLLSRKGFHFVIVSVSIRVHPWLNRVLG